MEEKYLNLVERQTTRQLLSLLHLILSVSQYEGVCFMSSGDDLQRRSHIWTGFLVLKFSGKSEIDEN